MSDFWLYFKLGLEHVLDWKAYDHILFLVSLCVSFTFVSWKRLLLLVTMFTVGHTMSLLLANYEMVSVSSRWIEFLIPVTILAVAIYSILRPGKIGINKRMPILYVITIFFGLIHGFGFASYYKMINMDGDMLPLLEFALGIEVSQVIIALVVLVLAYLAQFFFRFKPRDWILVVSSIVIGMVIPMLVENWVF